MKTPRCPSPLSACLILALLVASPFLLGFVAFFLSNPLSTNPSNIDGKSPSVTLAPTSPETLRLVEPTPLEGTPLVRMLLSQPSESGYGSLKGSYRTKNILVVDGSNSQSWWLLSNNNGLVVKTTDLLKATKKGLAGDYIASLYEVVSTDSNGDGQITWEDDSEAFLSSSLRGDWKPLTPGSKKILVAKQLSPTQALLIYQTAAETRTKTLAIPGGETLSENSVASTPNDALPARENQPTENQPTEIQPTENQPTESQTPVSTP